MEFLVRQSLNGAHALPVEERERLRKAERARAAELREAGVLLKLWRVLGSSDSIGLYCAPDADALHEALASLPMFPWMRFEVEPLVTHPQEQKQPSTAAG
jgi:muconolactone D-isomerase